MSGPIVARTGSQVADLRRHDLEELIPADAQAVLDVGCGAAPLGAELKRRGVPRVVGIEKNPATAAQAAQILDEVFVADLDEAMLELEDGSFDVIVYGDVLEHLVDPWEVLRRQRRLLRAGGKIVVSMPNVAHWHVVAGLLRGRFEYTASGPLDATHLRFFTRRSLEELCRQAGYEPIAVHPFLPRGKAWWLNRLSHGRLEHLLVWRYIVEARPA